MATDKDIQYIMAARKVLLGEREFLFPSTELQSLEDHTEHFRYVNINYCCTLKDKCSFFNHMKKGMKTLQSYSKN